MKQDRWIQKNCTSLKGKTIAVTGAAGGLGREICRGILSLEGNLILLNRSQEKSHLLKAELLKEYPGAGIQEISLDLTEMSSVDQACQSLSSLPLDILVHNAGAYKIPRATCSTGLDNVFQINFAAPYYMTKQLLPLLSRRHGKVVVMGSIACNYSKIDPEDLDFSGRQPCHLVYGNSKRYLMYGFSQLLKAWPQVDFAIAHPGVTFTNISNHYPKSIYFLLKWPMKHLLMKPPAAARGMLYALCRPVPDDSWVGPWLFHTWGSPRIMVLAGCSQNERKRIAELSETVYERIIGRNQNQ